MISLTSPVETRAHRWPAGAKLAGLCAASIGLYRLDALPLLAALAAVLALYALPGRAFWRAGMGHMRVILPFVLIVGAFHLATGTWAEGLRVIARMAALVGLANLVTMTTRLSEMIAVMRWLAAPLRRLGLRTEPAELAAAMVIRFTPVLMEGARALTESWRARSRKRPSWRLVLPFTILALEEADHVAQALKARGGLSQRRR